MSAPLVWVVLWIDEVGHGHGTCGHRHASADEATACPWEPAEVPPVGAGLVRQVRDPLYVTAGQELAAPRQLELAL